MRLSPSSSDQMTQAARKSRFRCSPSRFQVCYITIGGLLSSPNLSFSSVKWDSSNTYIKGEVGGLMEGCV